VPPAAGAADKGQRNDVDAPSAVLVSAGKSHTCILLADGGRTLCWGRNDKGQLGIGSTESPKELSESKFPAAVALSCGADSTCVITPGGERFCSGSESRGDATKHAGRSRCTPFQALTGKARDWQGCAAGLSTQEEVITAPMITNCSLVPTLEGRPKETPPRSRHSDNNKGQFGLEKDASTSEETTSPLKTKSTSSFRTAAPVAFMANSAGTNPCAYYLRLALSNTCEC
jgi:hypothetical protein